MALLGERLDEDTASDVVSFVRSCQVSPGGGFAGGPGQAAHLAPTYAAMMTLVEVGGAAAKDVVNRPALKGFLLRMKVMMRGSS